MVLDEGSEAQVAESLAHARIVSTASAKLSYLIDAIVQHQESEQIIVFYDHDNIAYYLAGLLEVVSPPWSRRLSKTNSVY